jgi:hypothetical protein
LHGKYVKLVTINSVIAFKVIYYLKINIYKWRDVLIAVMESDEPDAQSVQYMRDMYKGCMNEGK